MNISEIITGDRVLIQSSAEVKEVAYVRAILEDGKLYVMLSNGEYKTLHPQYVLKIFR